MAALRSLAKDAKLLRAMAALRPRPRLLVALCCSIETLVAIFAVGTRAQDAQGADGDDPCDSMPCGAHGACSRELTDVGLTRYQCSCSSCWNGRRCNIQTVSQSCGTGAAVADPGAGVVRRRTFCAPARRTP